MSAAVMPGTAFGEGYLSGLYARPDESGSYETEREREKYLDGRRIGAEERNAGALDPDVDQ